MEAEKKHFVITIGCEYGAFGNKIAEKIASDLGVPLYDRDTVDEIIDEVGISQDVMDKVEQGVTIAGKGVEGQERGDFSRLSDLTQRAVYVQKEIIKKLAAKESCVFVGRSADYILKGEEDNLLCIFIYSPNDVRVKNVMDEHKLSEKDAKILLIEKDKRFHTRHKAFTGSNRGDRHNRHMLIDSNMLGIDGTAEYIEELADKVFDLRKEA